LIPNPIGKVLSTIRKHRVRALLMGGQACILYGAAEFSRDVDLAILASEKNLDRLRQALADLHAEPVYYPPLGQDALKQGHACHFRVHIPEAPGLRVDVMSTMRGCDPFEALWARRRRFKLTGLGWFSALALADLVQAKKTQRDKDWPMIRRLVEVDYQNRPARPPRRQVQFWLREARTPALLLELCRRYPGTACKLARSRPLLSSILSNNTEDLDESLRAEEQALRLADRAYWQPLREELFRWRTQGRRPKPGD
jgi:hypothetical protein